MRKIAIQEEEKRKEEKEVHSLGETVQLVIPQQTRTDTEWNGEAEKGGEGENMKKRIIEIIFLAPPRPVNDRERHSTRAK